MPTTSILSSTRQLLSDTNSTYSTKSSLTKELASFVDFDASDAKTRQYLKDLHEEEKMLQLDEEEERLMDMEEDEALTTDQLKRQAISTKKSKKSSTVPYRDRLMHSIFADQKENAYNIEWFDNQCRRIDAKLPTRQKMEKFMITWSLWLQKLDRTKRYDDMMEFFASYSNQAPKVRNALSQRYQENFAKGTDEEIDGGELAGEYLDANEDAMEDVEEEGADTTTAGQAIANSSAARAARAAVMDELSLQEELMAQEAEESAATSKPSTSSAPEDEDIMDLLRQCEEDLGIGATTSTATEAPKPTFAMPAPRKAAPTKKSKRRLGASKRTTAKSNSDDEDEEIAYE